MRVLLICVLLAASVVLAGCSGSGASSYVMTDKGLTQSGSQFKQAAEAATDDAHTQDSPVWLH